MAFNNLGFRGFSQYDDPPQDPYTNQHPYTNQMYTGRSFPVPAGQGDYSTLVALLNKKVKSPQQNGQVVDVSTLATPTRRPTVETLDSQAAQTFGSQAAQNLDSQAEQTFDSQAAQTFGSPPAQNLGSPPAQTFGSQAVTPPMDARGKLMHDYRDLAGRAERLKKHLSDPVRRSRLSAEDIQRGLAVIDRAETFPQSEKHWAGVKKDIEEFRKGNTRLSGVYRRAKSAYALDDATADRTLAILWTKMMDPTSVTRTDEEQAVYAAGRKWDAFTQGVLNSVEGGGKMPPEIRRQIVLGIERGKNEEVANILAMVDRQEKAFIKKQGDHARYILLRGTVGDVGEITTFMPRNKMDRIRVLDSKGTLTPEQAKERETLWNDLPEANQTEYKTSRYNTLTQKKNPTAEQLAEVQDLEAELPKDFLENKKMRDNYNPGEVGIAVDLIEMGLNSATFEGYNKAKAWFESWFPGRSYESAMAEHINQLEKTASDNRFASTVATGVGSTIGTVGATALAALAALPIARGAVAAARPVGWIASKLAGKPITNAVSGAYSRMAGKARPVAANTGRLGERRNLNARGSNAQPAPNAQNAQTKGGLVNHLKSNWDKWAVGGLAGNEVWDTIFGD